MQTVYVSPAEFITQPGLLQLITSRANNLSLGGWAWHKQLYPARGQPRGEALPSSPWNRLGLEGSGWGGLDGVEGNAFPGLLLSPGGAGICVLFESS